MGGVNRHSAHDNTVIYKTYHAYKLDVLERVNATASFSNSLKSSVISNIEY